jgi:hypothetical protein
LKEIDTLIHTSIDFWISLTSCGGRPVALADIFRIEQFVNDLIILNSDDMACLSRYVQTVFVPMLQFKKVG